MQQDAKLQINSEVKEKNYTSNLVGQQKEISIVVQPGDAQQHMLSDISLKNNATQQHNPYQFQQINQALNNYHLQPQQPQNCYHYPNYIPNPSNTQASPYSYTQFQDYRQAHQNKGFHHRGRGRNYGRHQDNYYHYQPHPGYFHNYGYPNQAYPPQFQGYPAQFQGYAPQNLPGSNFGNEQSEHCQNGVCSRTEWPVKRSEDNVSSQIPIEDKKYKRYFCKQQRGGIDRNFRYRNRQFSRSVSSSEDEDDESQLLKKKYNAQISEFYSKQMKDLFECKNIKDVQRQKIIRVLMNRYPRFDAPTDKIKKAIEYLQSQNLLFYLAYAKVIKVSLNHNFDFNAIVPKLISIQQRKIKKIEADQKIKNTYGQQIEPMIDHHQLINRNNNKVVYLVDGNNIMPAVKHFRQYFKSYDHKEKITTQIRLRFFISIALPPESVILFFDSKFNEEEVKQIEDGWLVTNQQRQRYYKVPVIYGETEIADQKIVKKVRQLAGRGCEEEVILVSSDRQLFLRCKEIMNVGHTGGRFFFKCLKFKAKEACKGDKQAKKTFKAILHGIEQ